MTEKRARELLEKATGGVTKERIAKLLLVPETAHLEECRDERTGRRYGNAQCRAGRAVKIGGTTYVYQIWAVWE